MYRWCVASHAAFMRLYVVDLFCAVLYDQILIMRSVKGTVCRDGKQSFVWS